VVDGGSIESSAFGAGPGGDVRLTARDAVTVEGVFDGVPAGVSSRTSSPLPSAAGGAVTIEASRVTLCDGGGISVATLGAAPAGDAVFTTGEELVIDGAAITAETFGDGDAGDIDILSAPRLTLLNQGGIGTGTRFGGPDSGGGGGTITIDAGDVMLDGTMAADPAASRPNIASSARRGTTGDAGAVILRADNLTLRQAEIASTTAGSGAGGSVWIELNEDFLAAGSLAGVFAATDGVVARAVGGDVDVAAPTVTLADGATITAASEGVADAGRVAVRGRDTVDLRGATIATSSPAAGGGRIDVAASERIRLERSRIESSVAGADDTTAGDITIDPRFVVLDESAILATATAGTGGNISIDVGTLILSPTSRIDASAETGIDGTVSTASPAEDVSSRIAELSADFQDPDALLREGCDRRDIRDASTFVVAGAPAAAAGDGPLMAGYDVPGASADAPAPGAVGSTGCGDPAAR